MTIRKPLRSTLVEQVTEEIERFIAIGKWEVGDKIPPEHELVELFGVSRNTIREAIRSLVHTGMLRTKQGSGTHVQASSSFEAVLQKQLAQQSLQHTLEVRLALEREAATLAAIRRTSEDLERMQEAIERAERAIVEQSKDDFLRADFDFHVAVAYASHNDLLISLYTQLAETIEQSILHFIQTEEQFQLHQHVHHELFRAIREQQLDETAAETERYMTELMNVMERLERGNATCNLTNHLT